MTIRCCNFSSLSIKKIAIQEHRGHDLLQLAHLHYQLHRDHRNLSHRLRHSTRDISQKDSGLNHLVKNHREANLKTKTIDQQENITEQFKCGKETSKIA
jgi:hypothetical protein